MGCRWAVWRLVPMMTVGLVCVIAVTGVALAQAKDELERLFAEVNQLERHGKYSEAIPKAERAVALARELFGEERVEVAALMSWLAFVYTAQGRYSDAEPLSRRSLDITERAVGPEHPNVGAALNNLADLYRAQGRIAEAEPLLLRSLAIRDKALGPDHPDVAATLNILALLYWGQGRHSEAEPLYLRSLAIREKALGSEHPDMRSALNNLALLYQTQGRHAEAETLYRRSLVIAEKALGPEHPDVAQSLLNLAALYDAQHRYTEAEPLYQRSLSISEKALGPEHPLVGISVSNLAGLAYSQSQWAVARDYWQRSTGIIQRRTERGLGGGRAEAAGGEAQRLVLDFWGLVKASYRLGALSSKRTVAAEAFQTAQWALGSDTAASLAQMAARSAKGSSQLAALVRERQDLVSEWEASDKALIATKGEPPERRRADAEKLLADRLDAIDTRRARIDRRLNQEFPDYAAIVSPLPVSVAEVQTQLGTDEALVLFLDTPEWRPLPEETFIWVVTKTEVRWVQSELGTAALTREAAALRCGLDTTSWYGEGAHHCAELLKLPLDKASREGDPLPFDHVRAHRLYTSLFGEARDLIQGKHLLIVPSGPLTQLPFHMLVTRPPASGDHRAVAWLAREHAITVLPAVSSLKALRRVGRPSTAARPMLGFGNPLLDGPDARFAERAKLAREKQHCPATQLRAIASLNGPRAHMSRIETRGGLANVADIKGQMPLPETADELCAVAQNIKAPVGDIRLGAQATEREIKRLSASGELAKYRLLHFATHGYLSGQLDGTNEPGLILTPPDKATEEDDGYLSASEIAALKLDADWVILSACNTAAGAAANAEALSGLARAFIYAQARALLVSHWEVYSDATVKLITGAVGEMALEPQVGRAEALRRSILALIDKGEPEEAHPAYWAPFVVVGEGGVGR